MWGILFLILFIGGMLGLLIWVLYSEAQQSQKDWKTFNDLNLKIINTNCSKEEIESLHKELVEFGNTTKNEFIHAKLNKLDGFLRGIYKQYQQ